MQSVHKLGLFILCSSLVFQGYYIIRNDKHRLLFNQGFKKLKTLYPILEIISDHNSAKLRVLIGMFHVIALYKLLLNSSAGVVIPIIGIILNLLFTSLALEEYQFNAQFATSLAIIGGLIYILSIKPGNKN